MKKLSGLFILFLVTLLPSGLTAQQAGTGYIMNEKRFALGNGYGNTNNIKPLAPLFPLLGKAMHAQPQRSLVAGITGFYYTQKFFASSLKLTSISPVTGDTIHARPDTLIQNTRAGEMQMVIKPGLWLFPFLNVYAIAGYTKGTVKPNLVAPRVIVDFPGLGEQTIDTAIEIHDNLPYHGPVYGGGATLAFGMKRFFLIADYQYKIVDPDDLDGNLVYQTFSPKFGVLTGLSEHITMDFWAGAMYFSNSQTMHGKVKVSDFSEFLATIIGDDADYTGTIDPVHTWNFLAGIACEINGKHRISVEGGFVNRTQIRLDYHFRF